MVEINVTSLYYNVREDDGAVMIELLMHRQSSQPFEVVISTMDITATGMYVCTHIRIHTNVVVQIRTYVYLFLVMSTHAKFLCY